jgi:hypothetical protein
MHGCVCYARRTWGGQVQNGHLLHQYRHPAEALVAMKGLIGSTSAHGYELSALDLRDRLRESFDDPHYFH